MIALRPDLPAPCPTAPRALATPSHAAPPSWRTLAPQHHPDADRPPALPRRRKPSARDADLHGSAIPPSHYCKARPSTRKPEPTKRIDMSLPPRLPPLDIRPGRMAAKEAPSPQLPQLDGPARAAQNQITSPQRRNHRLPVLPRRREPRASGTTFHGSAIPPAHHRETRPSTRSLEPTMPVKTSPSPQLPPLHDRARAGPSQTAPPHWRDHGPPALLRRREPRAAGAALHASATPPSRHSEARSSMRNPPTTRPVETSSSPRLPPLDAGKSAA